MEVLAGHLQADQVEGLLEHQEVEAEAAKYIQSRETKKIAGVTHRSWLVPRTSPEIWRRSGDSSGICVYDRWALHDT